MAAKTVLDPMIKVLQVVLEKDSSQEKRVRRKKMTIVFGTLNNNPFSSRQT